MRKLFLIITVLLSLSIEYKGNYLSAEEKRISLSQQEIVDFNKLLKQKSDATTSLECDFVQEKNLEMLRKKMISKGIFRFRKDDKISFMYEEPLKYYMIINGTKLKIENNGKVQSVELKSNPLMKEMKGLIQASFLGRLSEMGSSYRISYFKKGNMVIVEIFPSNKNVSGMIKMITVTFDQSNMNVLQLQLDEGAGSSTRYMFSGQKFNTLKGDEKFNLN